MTLKATTDERGADTIRRLPGGSIDREHYERLARRARSEAFRQVMQRLSARIRTLFAPRRSPTPVDHREPGTHSQASLWFVCSRG